MSRLIDDLLNLSKVGTQTLEFRPVALAELVRDVIAELEPETRGRAIQWRCDPLPEVHCDPGLLRQVFANLISNAVKYTSDRGPAVIHVGRIQRNGKAVLFVRDNGAGFDMRYASKLFKPFSRLHTGEQFPGTGVGLATVERILRRHGGQIWAESIEGQGATFWFTLGPACFGAGPEESGAKTGAAKHQSLNA